MLHGGMIPCIALTRVVFVAFSAPLVVPQ